MAVIRLRTCISKTLYWGLYARLSRGFLAQVRCSLRARQVLQWHSPEQVRERQTDRLQRLLKHATQHVPYYRRLHAQGLCPDNIDAPEETASIPILTKDLIHADPKALFADNLDPTQLIERRSGGSTGNRLVFYVTPPALLESAVAERWGDALAGYEPGDPFAAVWGSHFDVPKEKPFKVRLHAYCENRLFLMSDRMDEAKLEEIVRKCQAFRPKILLGYGGSLVELARFIKSRGLTKPGFPTGSIITTAEGLSQDRRDLVGEAFQCPVFDRYGSTEAGLIAMECEEHQGLHINCEDLWVDLVACPDGPAGVFRIVVTKLREFGMPLIRYDLGDCLTGKIGTCRCGRGYPTIEGVKGRQVSTLRLPDGTAISGHVVMTMLDCHPLREYRVVQEADYSLRIEVVPGAGYDAQVEARIKAQLRPLVHDQAPVAVEVKRVIQRSPSGKTVPVISHVDLAVAAKHRHA